MKLLRSLRQLLALPEQTGAKHLSLWRAFEALERSLDRRSLEPPPFVQVMIIGQVPETPEPWRRVDALQVERTPEQTEIIATAGRLLGQSLTLDLATNRQMRAGACVAVIADPSVVRVDVVQQRNIVVGRDSFVAILAHSFSPGELVTVTVRRRHE